MSLNSRELPILARVVANETWLEGERQGREVDPHDPEVIARVAAVVAEHGAEWREKANREEPRQ